MARLARLRIDRTGFGEITSSPPRESISCRQRFPLCGLQGNCDLSRQTSNAGIAAFDQDVFVNAVGGVRIGEPAADLAVLLAIVSSMRNKPLPRGLVAFGEVGLAGEIRPAPRGQERLREAAKLGFSMALNPKANAPKQRIEGLEVIAVDRVEQALARVKEA